MLDFTSFEELWWSSIARPSSFMKEACNYIEDQHSVFAVISSAFPFRWVFRDNVANEFSTSLSIEYIDSAQELNDDDPGIVVVNRLNQTKVQAYNRCWSDADRFRILSELPGMDKTLIWVRSIPDEHVPLWVSFLHRYMSYSQRKGVFLLELISDTLLPEHLPQNTYKVDYASNVFPADLRLFTSMIAASLYPEQEQEYAATLSATLCRTDPEVAIKLLEGRDLCKVDVLSKLKSVRNEFDASSRGFSRGWDNPDHPFSLLDSGNSLALENRIWTAQLRVAFPIIEMERQALIAKYEQELLDALNHSYLKREADNEGWIENETGGRISDPFDLEIGNLYFMTKIFRYPDGSEYYWKGTSAQDRKRISFLRDRRNDLAHLNVVGASDFLPILYPDITP